MELNINQNVSDAFYRYKMPQLSAKVISVFSFLNLERLKEKVMVSKR